MALPVTIPNEFANATASIPLSQLDANFNTLANAVNGISDGSETLANVTATVANITTANVGALNTSGAVVFNDAGADVDFRVEGDTDANLLFVDAGNDRVGIGTSTPSAKLEITGQSKFYGNGSAPIFWGNTSSLGGLTYSGSNPIIQAVSPNDLLFNVGASERMRITSSGEVLVGGTTVVPEIFTALGAPAIQIQKNVGGSLAFFRNDTTVSSGNNFGVIGFYGTDTTSNTPTLHAYFGAEASGTHAAGDNPTDLVFGTTPDGSETVAEVARFTESKYLRFASGTGGIQFNGDTAAANALDDYEEGTFTPVVADATTGGNVASGTFSASYTKIGNVVTCAIALTNINTTGMTGANTLYIRGIPFASSAGVNHTGSCFFDRITFSGFVTPFIGPGETYMDFRESVSNASDVSLTVSDVNASGVSDIYLSITYLAA